MSEEFSRTERLLGISAVRHLSECRVAVFGVGGVGGYVCEALARSGIGAFDLIDSDTVALSNLNRQIIALHSTVGKFKVDVMADRIRDINPDARVTTRCCFFLPENAADFPFEAYDYVVDAVDTVAAKLQLAVICRDKGIPFISSMGAGNKLDPTRFRVSDISETNTDPLARVMRTELRRRGVQHIKVLWSDEKPLTPVIADEEQPDTGGHRRRATPGSTAFVPSVAGLIIAGEVVRNLIKGFEV